MGLYLRTDFKKALPEEIPPEKIIVIVGPREFPESKGLFRVIEELNLLNPHGGWIKSEFQAQIGRNILNESVAVILMLARLDQGAVASLRSKAADLGISCPQQILTVDEAKEALRYLAEVRIRTIDLAAQALVRGDPIPEKVATAPIGNSTNGSTVLIKAAPATMPVANPTAPAAPTPLNGNGNKSAGTQTPAQGNNRMAIPPAQLTGNGVTPAKPQSEYDIIRSLQGAALAANQCLTQLIGERDKLREEVRRRQGLADENIRLTTKVAGLEGENAKLAARSVELEEEVASLRATLDQFQSMINQVVPKKKG